MTGRSDVLRMNFVMEGRDVLMWSQEIKEKYILRSEAIKIFEKMWVEIQNSPELISYTDTDSLELFDIRISLKDLSPIISKYREEFKNVGR